MNTLILNRETFQMPDDGWYQIAPLGEFPHKPTGVMQVVDADACTAMVNAFREAAGAPNFAGLLIDFDHFSLDEKLKSEAAGWIVALEARGSGQGAVGSWQGAVGRGMNALTPTLSRGERESPTAGDALTLTLSRGERGMLAQDFGQRFGGRMWEKMRSGGGGIGFCRRCGRSGIVRIWELRRAQGRASAGCGRYGC